MSKICPICRKLKANLDRLIAKGEFNFSDRASLDCSDLYSKYKGNDGKFRAYIDDIRLCPDCSGNNMMAIGCNYEQTKHYHECVCGWKSSILDGKAF